MTVAVIIVAAGRGSRAGGGEPKQWRDLAGVPVLARTVAAFRGIGRITVVLHPDDMVRGIALFGGSVTLVAGGATRDASVRAALEGLTGGGVEIAAIGAEAGAQIAHFERQWGRRGGRRGRHGAAHFCNLGLNTSRRRSPTRLMATTVTSSARPG